MSGGVRWNRHTGKVPSSAAERAPKARVALAAPDNVQELRNRTLVGLQPHRSYQTAAVPCRRKGDHEQSSSFPRKRCPDRDNDSHSSPRPSTHRPEVLTVEEAEQVFDGAAKRSARLKDTAPDAERVIHHLHDALNWDKYYKWAADPQQNLNS
jgi:hypothetical protein